MLEFEIANNDKMKICRLISSPKTHEKKSAKTPKAVRRNDFNEIRIPEK